MFKKEFGISLYPEKTDLKIIKKYLIKSKESGFTKLFLSWLQVTENDQKIYQQTINFAKKLGFYVVLDVADNNFKFYEELDVNCIRLDSPSLPKQVADATYQTSLDIQLNMSNNDSFINNVWDYQPVRENLSGCHNFYPQLHSGLGIAHFKSSNKRFNDLGLRTAAFVNSWHGTDGPQKFALKDGVTTLEFLRKLPIKTQIKYLLGTKQIDDIYIGNQFATDEELVVIKEIDTKVIELDVILDKQLHDLETKILFDIHHFSRGDVNESYIRSTQSRVVFNKEAYSMENNDGKNIYHYGDVLLINSKNPNYNKELLLVITDSIVLDDVNLIGHVVKHDLCLIDLIKPWQRFKFKLEKEPND